MEASHGVLGVWYLHFDHAVPLLFTDNETNLARVFGVRNVSPFQKDGINDFVVHGRTDAINPEGHGTKAAGHYRLRIDAGATATIRLRLNLRPPAAIGRRQRDGEEDCDTVLTAPPHGIWPFTRFLSRWWIAISPSGSSCCCSTSGISIPTDSCRRANGTSMT